MACVCMCVPLVTFKRLRHVVSSSQRISEPLHYTLIFFYLHIKRERENNSNSLSLFESYQPLSLYFVQFSSHYIENRELSVHCTVSLFADVELVAEKGQEIKEMRREQRDSRPTPYIQNYRYQTTLLATLHMLQEKESSAAYMYIEKRCGYIIICFFAVLACITCSVRLSSAVVRDARSD